MISFLQQTHTNLASILVQEKRGMFVIKIVDFLLVEIKVEVRLYDLL